MVVVAGIVIVAVVTVFEDPVFRFTGSKPHPHVRVPPLRAPLPKGYDVTLPTRPFAVSFVILMIMGAVIIVTMVIIAMKLEIVQRILRLRRPSESVVPAPAESAVEEVLAAVDAGLAELELDDSDPRSAVIECWVRLERVAFLTGVERRADRTSSELVAQLLQYQRISEMTLQHFAELYRTARYSTRAVEASMRDDARESFRQLRRELLLSFGAAK
jgi:Domain of unknown function (DUF4129)